MMSKLEDNVNEILGIEKKEEKFSMTEFEQPAPVPRKIDESKDDIDNDYVNSRDNYYNLIDKGNEAIEGILDIAKEAFDLLHPNAKSLDKGKTIYLAETSNDQLKNRDAIKRELQRHGYKVVPSTILPKETNQLKEVIVQELDNCSLSISKIS
mgnify:CR=1 FL=1